MTLRDFTKAFMEANNIEKDLDAMIKEITAQARKRQQGGSAVLSEEEVEQIILGAELPEPVKEEKAEEKKPVVFKQKKPVYEQDGVKMEQLDLFGEENTL